MVVSAVTGSRLNPAKAELRELAARHRLALGGGASEGDGNDFGALVLAGDLVAAADQLTALHAAAQ